MQKTKVTALKGFSFGANEFLPGSIQLSASKEKLEALAKRGFIALPENFEATESGNTEGDKAAPDTGATENTEAAEALQTLRFRVDSVANILVNNSGLPSEDSDAQPIDYLERYAQKVLSSKKEKLGNEPLTVDELTAVVQATAAKSLLEKGFDTRAKIRAAGNDVLDKVPNVAEGSIKKLREWLG